MIMDKLSSLIGENSDGSWGGVTNIKTAARKLANSGRELGVNGDNGKRTALNYYHV